ncbi:ectoine hydroxylase [Gynuella sp.]|uniref:ectoine hydroxylase n=1 Tax=Gynuella sp. TaxID=2969146 RepID=UPI003D0B1C5B
MIDEQAFLSEQTQDLYPSRFSNSPHMLPRADPVVYSRDFSNAPIHRELIEQYEQQGFLVLENVFSEDEVLIYQQELKRLSQDEGLKQCDEVITEKNSGDVRSVFRIHELSPVFRQLARDSHTMGLARFLLGDQVYIHQSRLNYKPGYRGREFYWHSDFETWHVEDGMPRMRALSMSITLTENFYHNGPLMLIPGSHRTFVSCVGETPAEHYRWSLKRQEYGVPDDQSLEKLVDEGGIVSAIGKPDSLIIFDCNIMHGSNGNITPFPRSNVFMVYNAISNRVTEPFCSQNPRPEYICSWKNIRTL